MVRPLKKYFVCPVLPGVVESPIPAPVRIPKVKNMRGRVGMNTLNIKPRAAKIDPKHEGEGLHEDQAQDSQD